MKNNRIFLLVSLSAALLLGSCDNQKDNHSSSSDSSNSSSSISSSPSEDESPSDTSSSSSDSGSSSDQTCLLYNGYYSSLTSWENGDDLIQKLHNIISSGTYKPIEYSGSYTNWMSNKDADRDIYDRERLDVIYSGDSLNPDKTNIDWQREHAWPASLMTNQNTSEAVKTLGRATDFHSIFASYFSGNTSRGNKNYGNADLNASSFQDKGFASGGYRFDNKNFEPADCDKGRLSRAIFYMATMYNEPVYKEDGTTLLYGALTITEDYVDYDSTNYSAYAIGNLNDLLDWSKNAVDLAEYQHNESVYSFVPDTHEDKTKNTAQGNRNPYVDFPGLVDYAFGSKKDMAGSLSSLLSSYEALNIENPTNNVRTIISAKRSYEVGESFSKSDVVVGKYVKDMNIETDGTFSIEGVSDGEVLDAVCTKVVTIKTSTNSLKYSFEVKSADPFAYSAYSYTLTGKSSGGDLADIKENPGVDNEVDLGGVTWIIRYEKGAVGSKNSTFGIAFGTSKVPVETLTIRSKEAFSFLDKSKIKSIYLKGSAASGESYSCSLYVGDSLLKQTSLGYKYGEAQVISSNLETPTSGEVKFVISNITKAVYVHSLAVNLE